MIEKQLEDRMRTALTDEPPLGFDPDEVVDRAGRLRRQRRATFGAAAAVLVLAVGAVVVGGRGERGSGPASPDRTIAGKVCTDPPEGPRPRVNFPGSAEIAARLNAEMPGLLTEHVPDVPFEPEAGGSMAAYDCPPNVGRSYAVSGGTGEFLTLYLIHRRDRLDLTGDRYADDPFHELVSDEPAAGGARIRVYRNSELSQQSSSVVLRFGADGMITEASVLAAAERTVSEAQLTELASDPALHFDLPR
jgi:hypothetical protein